MQEIKNSVLTLEDEKKLSITGVASVEGFSEQAIYLTINGQKATILGEHLKILAFFGRKRKFFRRRRGQLH